jgi:hypothetical protein
MLEGGSIGAVGGELLPPLLLLPACRMDLIGTLNNNNNNNSKIQNGIKEPRTKKVICCCKLKCRPGIPVFVLYAVVSTILTSPLLVLGVVC